MDRFASECFVTPVIRDHGPPSRNEEERPDAGGIRRSCARRILRGTVSLRDDRDVAVQRRAALHHRIDIAASLERRQVLQELDLYSGEQSPAGLYLALTHQFDESFDIGEQRFEVV